MSSSRSSASSRAPEFENAVHHNPVRASTASSSSAAEVSSTISSADNEFINFLKESATLILNYFKSEKGTSRYKAVIRCLRQEKSVRQSFAALLSSEHLLDDSLNANEIATLISLGVCSELESESAGTFCHRYKEAIRGFLSSPASNISVGVVEANLHLFKEYFSQTFQVRSSQNFPSTLQGVRCPISTDRKLVSGPFLYKTFFRDNKIIPDFTNCFLSNLDWTWNVLVFKFSDNEILRSIVSKNDLIIAPFLYRGWDILLEDNRDLLRKIISFDIPLINRVFCNNLFYCMMFCNTFGEDFRLTREQCNMLQKKSDLYVSRTFSSLLKKVKSDVAYHEGQEQADKNTVSVSTTQSDSAASSVVNSGTLPTLRS